MLGFVGAPFTLATYLVEGASSRDYRTIKTMMAQKPEVLKALLSSTNPRNPLRFDRIVII